MPYLGIQALAVRLARTPFLRLTKAGVLRAVRKNHWPNDGLNQKVRVQSVYDLARQIMRLRARRFVTVHSAASSEGAGRPLRCATSASYK